MILSYYPDSWDYLLKDLWYKSSGRPAVILANLPDIDLINLPALIQPSGHLIDIVAGIAHQQNQLLELRQFRQFIQR